MWYKKCKDNNLNCMMRKTMLQYECCKPMLTTNTFVKLL